MVEPLVTWFPCAGMNSTSSPLCISGDEREELLNMDSSNRSEKLGKIFADYTLKIHGQCVEKRCSLILRAGLKLTLCVMRMRITKANEEGPV